MPKDKVETAIKKASGQGATEYEIILYEGYAPHGVALLVEAATDNVTRTVANVRHAFKAHGGNMGETGCVGWMFAKKGILTVDKSQVDEDRLMDVALDAGAEDVRDEGEVFEVVTEPEDFEKVKERLDQEKIAVVSGQISLLPKNTVDVDAKNVEQVLKLSEELEDHDDVQNVAANFNIPDELMDKAN